MVVPGGTVGESSPLSYSFALVAVVFPEGPKGSASGFYCFLFEQLSSFSRRTIQQQGAAVVFGGVRTVIVVVVVGFLTK